MRDPKRITAILAKIYRIWEKQPDTRLGQLLVNLCRGEPNWPDIFNIEDDRLIKLMEEHDVIKFMTDEIQKEINREVVRAIGRNPNVVEILFGK